MNKSWDTYSLREKIPIQSFHQLWHDLISGKYIRNSIGIQLFFAVTGVAFLSLGSLGYLFYQQVKAEKISLIQSAIDSEAKHLDTSLKMSETFLESLVAMTHSLQAYEIRSAAVYKKTLLSLVKRAKPQLMTGYGIMQTPYGLVDEQWFSPYIEESIGRGEVLKDYPELSFVELWQEEQYPNLDYYRETLRSQRFAWSEPYLNPSYPIPLVTYAGPIFNEAGQLIAVMNGDISLSDLQAIVDKGIPGENNYYIATTAKGTLLAYPPDFNKAKNLQNIQTIPEMKLVWQEIEQRLRRQQTSGYFESSLTHNFWFYTQIPTSKWVLMTEVTHASAVSHAMIDAIGATLLAMGLFALAIYFFINTLNRRLQPILEVCRPAMSLDSEVSHGDEIDRLSTAFFSLVKQQRSLSSELQQTNQNLTAATKLKDEFLANMSHELRTPLNAILGMTEAVLDKLLGPLSERQETALKVVYNSGQHLLALINQILDLSLISAGKLELSFASIRVQLLCRSSLTMVRPAAQKKQINLSDQIPDDLQSLKIWVDDFRIRQALINLLSNAIKFTPAGGDVKLIVAIQPPGTQIPTSVYGPVLAESPQVSESSPSSTSLERIKPLESRQAVITFQVKDTGIGIAPENFEKLFHAFVQLDSQLDRRYEGTGLGLALVQRIAELHDGAVTVESELGKGSCFTLWLPIPNVPDNLHGLKKQVAD